MNNGDMPASPMSKKDTDENFNGHFIFTGFTKREAFAKDAPAAISQMVLNWAELSSNHPTNEEVMEKIAGCHVAWADALLSALEDK